LPFGLILLKVMTGCLENGIGIQKDAFIHPAAMK